MTPITDKKPPAKIYRIVSNDDKQEPFSLINHVGESIRMDANPRRLADWALEFEAADFVRHDYSLVEYEASR